MEKKRFIFDLDGTLLKADYSSEEDYFRSCLSAGDSKIFIPQIPSLVDNYEKECLKYDQELLSKYLTLKSGVNITPEIIEGWRNLISSYEPNIIDGVIPSLEYLKSKNHSLVVLTNWFKEEQEERLRKAGLLEYFNEVFGGEFDLKPSVESFLRAAGEFSPIDCVAVGDKLETDVCGGIAAGMDVIYYNPKRKDDHDKRLIKSIDNMGKIREMY